MIQSRRVRATLRRMEVARGKEMLQLRPRQVMSPGRRPRGRLRRPRRSMSRPAARRMAPKVTRMRPRSDMALMLSLSGFCCGETKCGFLGCALAGIARNDAVTRGEVCSSVGDYGDSSLRSE